MALLHCGVVCELREVVLKSKPEAMLKVSAKGTVPVLLDGGRVIDESLDVMRWALTESSAHNWLEEELDHPLIHHNDHVFKAHLDHYKYFERYPEQPQDVYFNLCLDFLSELEAQLFVNDEGGVFLINSSLSVLDVAIFPFVRQFAFVDKVRFDNLALPKLQCWLEGWLRASLFILAMDKYPMWIEGQPQVVLFGSL